MTDKKLERELEKHFRLRLTEQEIKSVSQALEGFFEYCRTAQMQPPIRQTGYVLRALDKFAKAVKAGPDLVTIRGKAV